MSTVQRVAQIFGWVFVVIAIWGFVVGGMSMEAEPELAPKVMGLFAVNVLHNIVHLLFGIWGIMAARSHASARTYALASGTIYLVLTILGFLSETTFGLIPIGGNNIWLHALIAVILLGVGVSARDRSADTVHAHTHSHTEPAAPGHTPSTHTGTATPPPPVTPDHTASSTTPPPPPPPPPHTHGEGDRPA